MGIKKGCHLATLKFILMCVITVGYTVQLRQRAV